MSIRSEVNVEFSGVLSAMADGELDGPRVQALCESWRSDPEVRRQWHAYHLIGDVMRSDDLAVTPGGDAAFVARLRTRLAAEPVPLAPSASSVGVPSEAPDSERSDNVVRRFFGAAGRRAWAAPVAVAASFVAVAGVLLVNGIVVPAGDRGAPVMASVAPAADGITQVRADGTDGSGTRASQRINGLQGGEPQTFIASGQLIRDARLDRYLAAHKQFGGSTAFNGPAGGVRNASSEVPAR